MPLMVNETIPEAVHSAETAVLLLTEAAPKHPICNRRYWEVIRDAALAKAPLPAPVAVREVEEPMGEEEAARFAKDVVPASFTAFSGHAVGDVPGAYWDRIFDPTPFKKKLQRYRKSAYFQRTRTDG